MARKVTTIYDFVFVSNKLKKSIFLPRTSLVLILRIESSTLYSFLVTLVLLGLSSSTRSKNFLNASTKFITSKNNYKVANKSGWSGFAQHDVAIVFAENPYILVALSNLGYDNSYMSYFNKASSFANSIHQEYWKYKMNKCSNIKQYD